MIIHSIVRSMRKPVAAAVAVAALTWLGLVNSVEPAEAKKLTRCQAKHSMCVERCLMKSVSEDSISKAAACYSRTCDHQYRACARDSGEPSDWTHGWNKPKGPRGRPPKGGGGNDGGKSDLTSSPAPKQSPHVLGGGILQNGGGFSQQGPAATGAPAGAPSAPAAPPVMLR